MNRVATLLGVVLLAAFSPVAPVAAADETTEIEEQQFRLTLPGQWTGSHDEKSNGWTYISADGRDTVTVEIFRRSRGFGVSEMRKDLNEFLLARRSAAQKTLGPGAVVSSPEIKEVPGGLVARFLSNAGGQNRRGYTQIIVNKAVVGCFHYESLGMGLKEFSKAATSAFAQIGLTAK